jgi:hypothetical protein
MLRESKNNCRSIGGVTRSDKQIVSLDFNDRYDRNYFVIELGPNDQNNSTCTFTQQFSQNIVDTPSDYYCAITKFSIPAIDIPVFIPDFPDGIAPIAGNPTIYSVTLTYGTFTSGQTPVIFQPETGLPPSDEVYTYVFDIVTFLTWINTALSTALTALKVLVPAISTATAPWFQFETNEKISLVCTRAFYDNSLATPINIYLNLPLGNLLVSIPSTFEPFGSDPDPLGRDFLMNISNLYNNWYNPSFVVPSSPPLYYIFTQEELGINILSPLKAIRITSTSLPIQKEFIQTINSTSLSAVGVLQTFIPIFEPGTIRPAVINYLPTLYHMIDMYGQNPINRIDFNFTWIDGDNDEHPIYITYNTVASVEFAFFKKSTFTS